MHLVTLTDYTGQGVTINFDHVHFYRETNAEEKEHHDQAKTRIETDCFTFYVREKTNQVCDAITMERHDADDASEFLESIDDSLVTMIEIMKDKP